MYRNRRCVPASCTVVAIAVGCTQLGACGSAAETESAAPYNETLPFACGGARGVMLESRVMIGANELIDSSTLDHAHTFLVVLADRTAAVPAVRHDLDRWRTALRERSTELSTTQPEVAAGRLIARDTSALDSRLRNVLAPIADRLGEWVAKTCDGV